MHVNVCNKHISSIFKSGHDSAWFVCSILKIHTDIIDVEMSSIFGKGDPSEILEVNFQI